MKIEQNSFKGIIKSIDVFIKDHKQKVSFIGSFVKYDKDGNVADDIMLGFGPKPIIKLQIDALKEELKKESGTFINW